MRTVKTSAAMWLLFADTWKGRNGPSDFAWAPGPALRTPLFLFLFHWGIHLTLERMSVERETG